MPDDRLEDLSDARGDAREHRLQRRGPALTAQADGLGPWVRQVGEDRARQHELQVRHGLGLAGEAKARGDPALVVVVVRDHARVPGRVVQAALALVARQRGDGCGDERPGGEDQTLGEAARSIGLEDAPRRVVRQRRRHPQQQVGLSRIEEVVPEPREAGVRGIDRPVDLHVLPRQHRRRVLEHRQKLGVGEFGALAGKGAQLLGEHIGVGAQVAQRVRGRLPVLDHVADLTPGRLDDVPGDAFGRHVLRQRGRARHSERLVH